MNITERLHVSTSSHIDRMRQAIHARGLVSSALGWDRQTPLNERLAVAALSSVIMSISLGGLAFVLFVAYTVLR